MATSVWGDVLLGGFEMKVLWEAWFSVLPSKHSKNIEGMKSYVRRRPEAVRYGKCTVAVKGPSFLTLNQLSMHIGALC